MNENIHQRTNSFIELDYTPQSQVISSYLIVEEIRNTRELIQSGFVFDIVILSAFDSVSLTIPVLFSIVFAGVLRQSEGGTVLFLAQSCRREVALPALY